MATLTEETVGKLIAMAEGFQDLKQQVHQATQDSQQAAQAAKSVAQDITALKGSLSSDFASRMSIASDVDQGDDEQRRSDQALGFGGRVFKHNVYDLGIAADLVSHVIDVRKHQADLNQITIKLLSGSVDSYLGGQQLNSRYNNAKWQQELRHSDISTENQWEDSKELAGDIAGLEAAKSVQVPPAATEEPKK